jgi:hypothetical protein
MKTVDQLLAEFKIEGLDDKFVTALRNEVTEAHTQLGQATTLKTQAAEERAAAVAERAKIDAAIANMGDSSLTATQLKAQNKALRSALESLKEDGISLDLPAEIMTEPKNNGREPDPLADRFATVGQAIAAADISSRYVGIFGRPIPEDMQTLVDNARRAGKTVQQYADEKYKLSAEMQKRNESAEADRISKMKKEWEEEYKKAHPNVSENSFMRPGADSRFSSMPKIKREDPSTTRQLAGLSDMEKLRRAKEHAQQMLATQLQEN